jgi:hypothetical protein
MRYAAPNGPILAIAVRELCDSARLGVFTAPAWVLDAMRSGLLIVTKDAARLQLASGLVMAGGPNHVLVNTGVGDEAALHFLRREAFDALFTVVTPAQVDQPGDTHVIPVDDLRVHLERRTCWCAPSISLVDSQTGEPFPDDQALVVHQAMDGRELVEQHGVQ